MLNPPVNQRVSFSVRPDGTQDFTIAFNKEKTAEMNVRLNVGMMCTSHIHHKQQLQLIIHRHVDVQVSVASMLPNTKTRTT